MFQLSAEYLESSEERFKVQEELDEAEMGASDVTWEPPWNTYQTPVNSDWKQTQLELCELEHGDIFGHQGRITNAPRPSSGSFCELPLHDQNQPIPGEQVSLSTVWGLEGGQRQRNRLRWHCDVENVFVRHHPGFHRASLDKKNSRFMEYLAPRQR
ncbi:uncharacterized protein PITG_16241 [Phytophthora infestans T30-4]|uniref:Uncharacterized protein n=1 Tax=Phytophthora infestans (strain T30-4) TaxID=403677 RepID=D0NTG0_PHYIT|nr:uncharacterized protein PITG_16241 [Phytophthora infestans T30-4]EEY64911.1 conserved hypothetical protein [Phytophthora infestans T30-4]|eukprot:XP_002897641.1 conserved hypothetical protein [Phytophthora infestans T30-4]